MLLINGQYIHSRLQFRAMPAIPGKVITGTYKR